MSAACLLQRLLLSLPVMQHYWAGDGTDARDVACAGLKTGERAVQYRWKHSKWTSAGHAVCSEASLPWCAQSRRPAARQGILLLLLAATPSV
jgi:hypothetical protein